MTTPKCCARGKAWFFSHKPLVAYLMLAVAISTALYRSEDLRKDSREGFTRSGTAVSIIGCNRDFDTLTKIRGLLQRLDDSSAEAYDAGRTTLEVRRNAKTFYKKELESLSLPDCRLSRVTDEQLVTIPYAFYPGGPKDLDARNRDGIKP